MTAVADDSHHKLSLHVGDGELGVHALGTCQEKTFLRLQVEEGLSQSCEPLGPVLLRRQQVRPPYILRLSDCLIHHLLNLCRHGYPSTALVLHLATEYAVLDHRLQVREVNRSIFDDLFHKGESIHSCAFNDIDDAYSHDGFLQITVLHLFLKMTYDFCCNGATHRVSEQND